MGLIKEDLSRQNRKRFGVRSSNFMLEEQFRSRCRNSLKRMESANNTVDNSKRLPERVILEPIKKKLVLEQKASPRRSSQAELSNLNQDMIFPERLNKQLEQIYTKHSLLECEANKRASQSHHF